MSIVYVSQAATTLGLKWYPNDTVDLQFYVKGVNWSGSYTAKLRQYQDPTSTELATFTVTATYENGNNQTLFRIQLSTNIAEGEYWWACTSSADLTRFSGPVIVSA